MTAERWTRTVRQQVGLGRLLPLGGPRDGAWIFERAAGAVLRRAVERAEPGLRLDGLRIALASPEDAAEPVVPAPPSALPPGALRVTARFAAPAAEPLPVTADRLRAVLSRAAAERIGLVVTEVDLGVTELLDADAGAAGPAAGSGPDGTVDGPGDTPIEDLAGTPIEGPATTPIEAAESGGGSDEERVAAAALAVPGVSRLTGALGRPVHLASSPRVPGGAALAGRHVRVDLAVGADHRALDVARSVRAAVSAALPDRPTVAVLVTAVD
ncbi:MULTISPECIES: nucleopolyhedrovirus P10 family protein [unclassified Streptomyces]|uniref:nucleopolyhedrovirus P10 family protein n=1 Tax=unclassified Streptomyces TaxID=2593676 RepID=UPI0007EC9CBD|nr:MULTISPECIES: nucleopolyhedrovirus P10 family protein [unclassified Streptomyces]MCP3766192.1 nucleopolyhedrovirus P10 family protein [Streptomyces sp. MAR25Y5]OBQ47570.1 nucleopolyhedrovirus P10 family protein [Streptomyces sp. H-KF8]